MSEKQKKSLPQPDWPPEIREKFNAAFATKRGSHLARLRQMMGRWLLEADKDRVPPNFITLHLIERRTSDLNPESRSIMKQALFEVFDYQTAFVPIAVKAQTNERQKLARVIQRNLPRFPDEWRTRIAPMLHLSSDELSDGAITDVRAPSAIISIIHLAAQFFDFCRTHKLPIDLVPSSFRKWVAHRHKMFIKGAFSFHTMVTEAGRLLTIGRDVYPERDWNWLKDFHAKMKKQSCHHPSRANQRFVALAELRIAAIQGMEVAKAAHENSTGYRARLQAHTLARTMLSILMLINSPLRVSSLGCLDLKKHFDAGITELSLAASETKDKNRDVRYLPEDIRDALKTYISMHRPLVAPIDETRLFVGWRGAPCSAGHLSEKIGDMTEALFGSRISAHMIRNVVAAFIVSEAPNESALASEVLNHRRGSSTQTYCANGSRIVASRKLQVAADAMSEKVGVIQSCERRKAIKKTCYKRPKKIIK
jgi:integrase